MKGKQRGEVQRPIRNSSFLRWPQGTKVKDANSRNENILCITGAVCADRNICSSILKTALAKKGSHEIFRRIFETKLYQQFQDRLARMQVNSG
jgi:hypothetical protein